MHQIDIESAIEDMVEFSAVGTPGYFTPGDQETHLLPTRVDADWLNAAMLEVVNVIVTGGEIELDKTVRNQLYQAIYKLIYGSLPPTPGGDIYDNPFTEDTTLRGMANHSGANINFIPAGSSGIYPGEVHLIADNINVSGSFELNDNDVVITGFSDDESFSSSDALIPTQHAFKTFIDDFDAGTITPGPQPSVINAELRSTITTPGYDFYMGLADAQSGTTAMQFSRLTSGTLRNLKLKWASGIAITGVFTMYVDGSSTAMSITLTTDSSGYAEYIGDVSTDPNKQFCLRCNISALSADLKIFTFSVGIEP